MLGRVGVCAVHSATRQTNTASFSIVEFSEEPKSAAKTQSSPMTKVISHAICQIRAHAHYEIADPTQRGTYRPSAMMELGAHPIRYKFRILQILHKLFLGHSQKKVPMMHLPSIPQSQEI